MVKGVKPSLEKVILNATTCIKVCLGPGNHFGLRPQASLTLGRRLRLWRHPREEAGLVSKGHPPNIRSSWHQFQPDLDARATHRPAQTRSLAAIAARQPPLMMLYNNR